MARQLAVAAALLVLLGSAGGVLALSITAREPGSLLSGTDGPGAALVAQARQGGMPVQRLLSGPSWLEQDPRLDPADTLLLVVDPPHGFRAPEVAAFQAFLERGGRALVVDTFGGAGTLTAPLGITFERVRLVESGGATDLPARLEGQPFRLALGPMTGLHLADNRTATVLAASSPVSFLDRDGDGLIGAGDPGGPFPVVAERSVGSRGGRLVVAAVAGPFSDRPGAHDDEEWRAAILRHLLPAGGRLVVDESRAGSPDPVLRFLSAAAGAASTAPWSLLVAGFGGLALLAALLPRPDQAWESHRFLPLRFLRRSLAGRPREDTPAAPARSAAVVWTRRGGAALFGGLGLLVVAWAVQSRQAAFAGAALVSVALATELLGAPGVRAARRLDATNVVEGAPIEVQLKLQGSARHHHMELEFLDHVPPDFEVKEGTNWFRLRLGPEGAQVRYTATPALRGPYGIG
ncbi:MAG: DUF4350 domain-containing protein, partial [Halobacteriales archaeon]|nr:DUF4350 domain-containing protein [Halobacteriales archaeon]